MPVPALLSTGECVVQGVRLAWTATPSAAPDGPDELLLFVHGWAGSREIWSPTLRRLCGRRHCLAIDLPGHGDSADSAEHVSLEALAGIVSDLVHDVGEGPATLIGHSMGTSIALTVALCRPAAAARLVLVGPAHPQHLLAGVRPAMSRPWLARPVMQLTHGTARALGTVAPRHGEGRLGAALRRQRAGGRVTVTTLERTLRSVVEARYHEALAEVRVPVLLVVGGWDMQTRPAGARLLADGLPDSRIVLFARCGHHPMVERADAFVETLEAWLDAGPDACRPDGSAADLNRPS